MATGRTTNRWKRCYMDGWDLSGYGISVGPLSVDFDLADLTAPMGDSVKGGLPNQVTISPGTFNGVLSSTTDSGMEISRIQTAGTYRDIMIPIGTRTAPALGDAVFCCKSPEVVFHIQESGGGIFVNAEFGPWDASDLSTYRNPWGNLLIPYSTLTVTTTGDSYRSPFQASTTYGGFLVYQIFTGSSGGWTIHIEDSTDDNTFADVEGATVTIADVSTPQAGIVETTAHTTQVDQYVRAIATEDSAGTLICAVAFVRAWF